MNGERPAIVYLTPVLPASRGNGLAMRAGLFLAGMSLRHSVTVVVVPVFGSPSPERSFVDGLARSCVTLDLAVRTDKTEWPTAMLSSPAGRHRARELYPLPRICRRPSAEGCRQLRDVIQGVRLVHVMRTYLAPCLDFLFDAENRPPITLDLDELDSEVHRQLGCEGEAERFERLERYYVPRADYVFTASELETRMARETHCIPQVGTVANAVWPPAPTEPTDPHEPQGQLGPLGPKFDLLFVGSLSYAPNIDAARWLCEEIRPLLGGVSIAIVGSHPGADVRRLAELPGVTVAGDVPNVAPWYARSRVAVAPLRIGGGTRIKILEALAHGRPVVATTKGASGLGTGEQNGILIGDDAGAFAGACRRLLVDVPAAGRIAANGAGQVRTPEEVAQEIDQLTRAVLDNWSDVAGA